MSTAQRPSTQDLGYLTAEALAAAYRAGTLSPVEVAAAVLDRIERLNPKINAFLFVDRDGALTMARESEARLRAGRARGPLDGVPVTIKDLLDVKGLPTTSGSAVYRGVIADADSIVTERLRAAGAVILGKTNTPEFGLIPTTENELGDACRNPWDTARTPGGSSGGAAAAAAAGLGPLHVGTDGGGSIRIPAALCGVFGLKPTYGRVARSGLSGMPMFSHTGPITRTVADAALMLDAIAGPDPRDVTAMEEQPPRFREALGAPLGSPRVAFWAKPWDSPSDPEIERLVGEAARRFASLGCRVEEAGPETEPWRRTFLTIIFADEYTLGGHLMADHKDELAPYTRRTFEMGAKVTVPEYSGALRALERFRYAVARFFDDYDLLLMPVTAVPAYLIGQPPNQIGGQEVDPLGSAFPFTAPFNLTGNPAASLPCGFTAAGLPVAIQVVGRRGDEIGVLRACAAFEAAYPWQDRRPPLE
jgi:aspartyl-tRNA(Asn)/glutamyl-tRNA(Gln) amidotransferase subunit A